MCAAPFGNIYTPLSDKYLVSGNTRAAARGEAYWDGTHVAPSLDNVENS
jgi:hypothetical protein